MSIVPHLLIIKATHGGRVRRSWRDIDVSMSAVPRGCRYTYSTIAVGAWASFYGSHSGMRGMRWRVCSSDHASVER